MRVLVPPNNALHMSGLSMLAPCAYGKPPRLRNEACRSGALSHGVRLCGPCSQTMPPEPDRNREYRTSGKIRPLHTRPGYCPSNPLWIAETDAMMASGDYET